MPSHTIHEQTNITVESINLYGKLRRSNMAFVVESLERKWRCQDLTAIEVALENKWTIIRESTNFQLPVSCYYSFNYDISRTKVNFQWVAMMPLIMPFLELKVATPEKHTNLWIFILEKEWYRISYKCGP